MDVENDVLRVLETTLREMGIKYGTLCFDGLMVYRRSVHASKRDISAIVSHIESVLKGCFGYTIHLKVKDMDEDVSLADLMEKREIRTDELALAETVLDIFSEDFKYDFTSKTLWFWIEDETHLWQKQSFGYFGVIMVKPLETYLSQHPDKDHVEETCKALYTNSLTLNILAHIRRRVEIRRDDDFIKENFDTKSGLFPVGNGMLIDLHTNTTRLREKTDYFTMASEIVPEPITAGGREAINQYIKEILVTDSQEYVNCLLTCLAYCLTGENNKKVIINLIGARDAGKSLFLRLISKIMGPFSGAVNERVVIKKKNEAVHDSEILSLINLRIATISELLKYEQFNVKTLKAISGGDEIDARGAGDKGTVKLNLKCVLMVATNEMPHFKDLHFASRLRCFHFKNTFDKVPAVERRMIGLCPQFLSLLSEYSVQYYQSGEEIKICKEVDDYTRTVIESRNSVVMFLKTLEKTDKDSDYIRRPDMFLHYLSFCVDERITSPEKKSDFYEYLDKEIGSPKQKKKDNVNLGYCYSGIKWVYD